MSSSICKHMYFFSSGTIFFKILSNFSISFLWRCEDKGEACLNHCCMLGAHHLPHPLPQSPKQKNISLFSSPYRFLLVLFPSLASLAHSSEKRHLLWRFFCSAGILNSILRRTLGYHESLLDVFTGFSYMLLCIPSNF